jgi:hypothetical protein
LHTSGAHHPIMGVVMCCSRPAQQEAELDLPNWIYSAFADHYTS